ncbi:LOW QUALITY PROTEIN: interleukin-17 receptor B [Ciconia maguari]
MTFNHLTLNFWRFHYVGFPVELETKYSIHAYNLPPADIKEGFPSKSILLTTAPPYRHTVIKAENSDAASSLAVVQLPLRVEVLVIYPEVCFHHTFSFAELLCEGCQTDVILDMEKRRIADKGPVQWLAAQKAAADRVIFLRSNPTTAACDVSCKSMRNHNNMEHMFTLAVNLFCSDMTNQSSVQKYMVISFSEVSSQDTLPSALNFCPKYCLMKDIENFCRDLSVSRNEVHGKK